MAGNQSPFRDVCRKSQQTLSRHHGVVAIITGHSRKRSPDEILRREVFRSGSVAYDGMALHLIPGRASKTIFFLWAIIMARFLAGPTRAFFRASVCVPSLGQSQVLKAWSNPALKIRNGLIAPRTFCQAPATARTSVRVFR